MQNSVARFCNHLRWPRFVWHAFTNFAFLRKCLVFLFWIINWQSLTFCFWFSLCVCAVFFACVIAKWVLHRFWLLFFCILKNTCSTLSCTITCLIHCLLFCFLALHVQLLCLLAFWYDDVVCTTYFYAVKVCSFYLCCCRSNAGTTLSFEGTFSRCVALLLAFQTNNWHYFAFRLLGCIVVAFFLLFFSRFVYCLFCLKNTGYMCLGCLCWFFWRVFVHLCT